MSERLIDLGIENFKKRHNKVKPYVPKRIKALKLIYIFSMLPALPTKPSF